jgi:hypothetical protein
MRTQSHSTESCLQSYRRVSDLVQQGLTDEAREVALAIPVDHLRCRALLLANDSREVRRPDSLRR